MGGSEETLNLSVKILDAKEGGPCVTVLPYQTDRQRSFCRCAVLENSCAHGRNGGKQDNDLQKNAKRRRYAVPPCRGIGVEYAIDWQKSKPPCHGKIREHVASENNL